MSDGGKGLGGLWCVWLIKKTPFTQVTECTELLILLRLKITRDIFQVLFVDLSMTNLASIQIQRPKLNICYLIHSQGYIVRISGGNDKQGFPMKQGVLTHTRVRLLLAKGHSCYRPRRKGERKRKSVRGCIVDANLAVLNLVVIKKGQL